MVPFEFLPAFEGGAASGKERNMPVNAGKNRPDFKLEIRNGKLTLQTRVRTVSKTWLFICTIVIIILIALVLLKPEGWLDILRAVLLILELAFLRAEKAVKL
jgi:hypothetical protein